MTARRLAPLAAGLAGAYVLSRVAAERRAERRLARPVAPWPDVPGDDASAGTVVPALPPGDVVTGSQADR